jgi:hypothetical protein
MPVARRHSSQALGITMSTKERSQSERGTGLIFLAWVASVVAVPICFFAFVGAAMSASAPHASIGELLLLGAGPLVAIAALLRVASRTKITPVRFVLMFIPAALSLAELGFTALLWKAG